jgi:nitroimidazol reductase NimA-like FMN-containing flavoprotein (pyridoxamine 5'-phosphate oxidase superfamily)
VVVDGRPHILPVNYELADDDVVFRTAEGTLLDAAASTPLAFEVDGIVPASRSGWNVCVHGHSVALDRAHRERAAPVDSWAPRHRDHWYRVVAEEITGRRLFGSPRHEDPADRS